MKNLLLLSCVLLFPPPLFAMGHVHQLTKIHPTGYKAPERLGNIKLYATPEGYAVKENGYYQLVKNHEIDPLLKQIQQRNCLNKFLQAGYISIDKMEDGNFKLQAKMRLLGGGPATGAAAGASVRIAGYGGYAIACFFNPLLLAEVFVVGEAIEATAQAATIVGLLSPTP